MTRIAFFTEKDFDGRSVREVSTGGIKAGTVNLAEALARRGHRVEVYSLTGQQFEHNGVTWRPFGECAVNFSTFAASLSLVFSRWSLVVGRWSLVVSRWSLVVGR